MFSRRVEGPITLRAILVGHEDHRPVAIVELFQAWSRLPDVHHTTEHAHEVVLETNSVGIAGKLGKEGQDRSLYGPLVEEIKTLLQSFDDFSVRSVGQSENEVAH